MELKRRLEEEEKAIVTSRIIIATKYMATPLVLAFSFIDLFFAPQFLREFFSVRLFIIPVSLIAVFSYRLKIISERFYAAPSYLVGGFLGIYNSYLIAKTGFEVSSYYAGLNLVAIGGLYFLPLRPLQLGALFSSIYVPYFLTIAFKDGVVNLGYFVPHSAFILATSAMGFIVNYFNRKLRISDLGSRLALHEEILNKETVIQRKTKEGIFLEKLAIQFSPQVIEAIKSSQITLGEKRRGEITCIFLDIENSTGRSTKIDFGSYLDTVLDFLGRVQDILLTHNVTIGTYLGDGLLAFTNAPQKEPNHRVQALKACVDIIAEHEKLKRYYSDKWRTEFNIRIGINTGYAYLGFFPNPKKGTYTAVGEAVNLASRLCSRGPKNAIAVTKEFIKDLETSISGLEVSVHGVFDDIKGFEGETFQVYSIKGEKRAGDNSATEACPLCGGSLFVQADLVNTVLIKCSKCSYTDIQDKGEVGTLPKVA